MILLMIFVAAYLFHYCEKDRFEAIERHRQHCGSQAHQGFKVTHGGIHKRLM
jgi:hypothetical protein